ncbi:MAG: aa3-type cytochrome c oxidase subunit IV [Pseudomonadota bacterium]
MADQSYEVNNDDGAPMDYAEHEKTYSMFLWLTKWGVIFNVALLLAMAVGFFMGGGFLGGIFTFIVLMIAAKILA